MDKQTLSNYGWIIILVLILAVLLALASPFGLFVSDAIKGVTGGFWDVNSAALNVAGIDTGNVGFPAKCGVKGHYQGDGKEHEIAVTECNSGHTYTCECENGWEIPECGKYYVGVTSTTLGDYTGATKVYSALETLPCGYTPTTGDTFVLGDYEYKYKYLYNPNSSIWISSSKQEGWGVRVLDKNKTKYSEICESIANKSITNMNGTFSYCTSLITSPIMPKDTTDMSLTFSYCTSLTTAPITPNNVTKMEGTFTHCTSLITYHGSINLNGDFSNYKIPNKVTNMYYTFESCTSLTKAPAIPSTVTNMEYTFSKCYKLITPPDMSKATNVTNMRDTFSDCTKLTIPPDLSNSINITDMMCTFDSCSSLTTAPDISKAKKLTNMNSTFYGCTSLTTAPVILDNVTNIKNTFLHCKNLKTYIGNTDTDGDFSNYKLPSGITSLESTFNDCKSLIIAPEIPNSVTNMEYTFNNCESLTTSPKIIPKSVTNMKWTFANSEITTTPVIPNSVTNMEYTFNGCHSLTGIIEINANPLSYSGCFFEVDFTTNNIELTGSSRYLDRLGATGKNYCSTCNGKCLNNH